MQAQGTNKDAAHERKMFADHFDDSNGYDDEEEVEEEEEDEKDEDDEQEDEEFDDGKDRESENT